MKLLIKEIDRFNSVRYKDKVVSEYIIYVVDGEGTHLFAFTEIGDIAKKARVNELILTHFDIENYIKIEDIVEEASLFEN